MPEIPYLVTGKITNSAGIVVEDAIIEFTTSKGSGKVLTDSDGKYLIDLMNIGYTSGETVTYLAEDRFKNEKLESSFVITGGNRTENVALVFRTDKRPPSGNRDSQIANIGGIPVSGDNPLPVTLVNTADIVDLTNNPNTAWTYDASGRVITETVTIRGISYKRTFTYTGSNFSPVSRSKWSKI